MKLREIMTTDFCCASPSDSLSKVAGEMKRHNVGVMPVCQNGSLIGMITDRDIVIQCVAAGNDPDNCKVADFMTKELIQAHPDMEVSEAARLMGLPDAYRLPATYNEAYHLLGDGVVAPVVRHLAEHWMAPMLTGRP